MSQTTSESSFPNFHREVIDVNAAATPRSLIGFPFQVKGKRKNDLISFGLGTTKQPGIVTFHENPRNRDPSRLPSDISQKNVWEETTLQSLWSPSMCTVADISGNGFYDVIVADEYGATSESAHPSGRISWLENFGTDDGDWMRRDIGGFPGVNCLKVGHFTTTFSLQVLAVILSTNAQIPAPLIVFTRPSDVYKSGYWLATIALQFTAIQGCLIVKATDSGLDKIVISSREGLTVVWYSDRQWNQRSIGGAFPGSPGQLAAGRIKSDAVAFIVSAEALKGSALSVYVKSRPTPVDVSFESISWTRIILEDFDPLDEDSTSIRDILCADLDGDGTDEILVAVSSSGSRAGIYYYDLIDGQFLKHKLSDESVEKITPGRFTDREKMDFATISWTAPRAIGVYFNSFITSEIKPSVKSSELTFHVPHAPSSISEADVIDIAGRVHSLVLLPPNASFSFPTDGTNAVKVLHGCLGWIDTQSALIERTRTAASPGCVTSMLVDSPEGYVRSGDDGAVFVRMRPSRVTNDTNLRAVNMLPTYFPCEVRDVEFLWQQAAQEPWFSAQDMDGKELYQLPGYNICFDESSESVTTSHSVYVHLWAAAPGVSSGFHKHTVLPKYSGTSHRHLTQSCSIRACLSNPAGDGGLHIYNEESDGGGARPDPVQLSKAQITILPVMHEQGPIWRSWQPDEGTDGSSRSKGKIIDYPWHAWVAGGQSLSKKRVKWDVWVAFEFPPFDVTTGEVQPTRHSCVVY